MAKFPSMQWYIGDWMKDPEVGMMGPLARGVWFDWLNTMHELDRCGQLTGTTAQLARVGRCTPDEVAITLAELKATNAGDVSGDCHSVVTVTNRRMHREYEERLSALSRKRNERGKPPPKHAVTDLSQVCHGNVTQMSRSPSSSSSSSSIPPPTSPSVEAVLGWAGMGRGRERCAKIKGMTPVAALMVALDFRDQGKGPGLVYEYLSNGYTPPKLIPPETISKLARGGFIASVCGFMVNTTESNVRYGNHALYVGGAVIEEKNLLAKDIVVCLERSFDAVR